MTLLFLKNMCFSSLRTVFEEKRVRQSRRLFDMRNATWVLTTIMLLVTACTNGSDSTLEGDSGILLLTQRTVREERAVMEAELVGRLVIAEECLRVIERESEVSYLLIW